MQNDSWTPSGSRWEPVPEAATASSSESALPSSERTAPRRPHWHAAAALLLTLLGAGAVSAGATYAAGDSAVAGPTGQPSAQVVGEGHGGRHAHGPHGASS